MPHPIEILERDEPTWTAGDDRRASRRHAAHARVCCMPATKGSLPPIWSAAIRDLSSFGVGLNMPIAPGHGQILAIELKSHSGAFLRTILARVVHEARETSQSFLIGCAFVSELNEEHMRAFQAGAVHPAAPDCRRWTRFACNVETACYTSETAPGERRSGRILNISAGGVGLLLRCQFSAGTLLHFELPPEMNLAQSQVLVRVVRVVEQSDGNWLLGCEFADQLTDDEIRSVLR